MSVLFALPGKAQDIAAITAGDSLSLGKKILKTTSVSGGISANYSTYSVTGIQSRRDPYNWSIGGNINVTSMEVQLPFSFYFTNQDTDFRQPFNQFGVSPKYKWATGHFGYRNVTWSEYTLAGHTFLGAGIELDPGIFRFGLVWGRFRSAAEPNNELGQIPSYRRMGYGMRIGIGDEKGFIDLISFHGKDDPTSLQTNPDSLGIYPAENLTVGIVGRKKLMKNLTANFEIARSAYTEDVRSGETALSEGNSIYNNIGFAFTPRATTSYNNAYTGGVAWSPGKIKTGLRYRRVEGEYQSMGAYFFNNDLEDYTLTLGVPLAKNKVNFNGSVGLQRNNLNDDKVSRTSRVIGSANIFWLVSQQISTGLSYSNYTSTLRAVRDEITDSINFYQVNHTANLFANYNFGTKEKQHSLMFNAGAQRANARQEYSVSAVETKFNNAGLNYRLNLKDPGWIFTAGYNITSIESMGIQTLNSGPLAGVAKTLFDKKVRIGLNHSLIWQNQNGTKISLVNLTRTGINYKPHPKHQFDVGATLMNKNAAVATVASFTELRATFGYRYNF